ncbi:MAG: phage holin family protein [Myxococcales bacterium]|nr:phage holin family protein [Myxococcales bacterium]
MKRLLTKLVLVSLTIAVSPQLIGGVSVGGIGDAVRAALMYGLLYVVVGWLLSAVVGLLAIVPGILTLGLFFFLVPVIVHTILLKWTAGILHGFTIRTWTAALLLSVLLGLLNFLIDRRKDD